MAGAWLAPASNRGIFTGNANREIGVPGSKARFAMESIPARSQTNSRFESR